MKAASLTLLLGVVGVAAVVLVFPFTLVRARRAVLLSGAVPSGLLILAVALGVLLVLSVAAIVGVVVLA